MANRRSLIGEAAVMAMSSGGGIDTNNYLTIVALKDGLTAKLSDNACEYCVDGDGNWKTLSAATNTETINTGQTLSFRGNLNPSNSGIGTFTLSKSCNLEGNCMSMLFGDNAASNTSLSGKNYAFYKLFYNCNTIKSVSSGFLPATTLSTQCYYYMFYGCTNLTTAPVLPATDLAGSCYAYMFNGCNSLTQAPSLISTDLADYCYYYMFKGCTNLTTSSELPATTVRRYCYSYMFYGCTNLRQTPELPATTLADYCYSYMFYGCTNLTQTPELPATTLVVGCYRHMLNGTNLLPDCSNIDFSSTSVASSAGLSGLFAGTKVTDDDLERLLPKNSNGKYYLPAVTRAGCYADMFYGCTNLTTAPELPATVVGRYCYSYMFYGCTNLTTAPSILPATTLADNCYEYMFKGCTSLTQAPELPATTLAIECCRFMFENCTSLTTVPSILPATTLKLNCYYCMFHNCSNITTAPELPATTLVEKCYHLMFGGCSKLSYIKAMFTTTPTTKYTDTWVYRVASTGTFIKNKDATWNVRGNYGIPSGWTVQTV